MTKPTMTRKQWRKSITSNNKGYLNVRVTTELKKRLSAIARKKNKADPAAKHTMSSILRDIAETATGV